MNVTVVLNGCDKNYLSRAEEAGGFLEANLGGPAAGRGIVFYRDTGRKEEIIARAPAVSLTLVKVARYQPENALEALTRLEKGGKAALYLFPGDFFGSELAVRFAFRMGGSSLAAVQAFSVQGERLACKKAVYAGYLQGEFTLSAKPYCLSMARDAAGRRAVKDRVREVAEADMTGLRAGDFCLESGFTGAEDAGGLERSPFILAAGRGVNSREGAVRLQEMAAAMGAQFGVSRPVAMNGWAPLDRLIGVSGALTKPQLCIAAGVSGAAAFYAGIEQSRRIVAINTDARAPLVQAADAAVIDDWDAVLKALLKQMEENRST